MRGTKIQQLLQMKDLNGYTYHSSETKSPLITYPPKEDER